jgi:hypothetical protein
MTGEPVPAWLVEAGNVIHVCHHHDSGCGGCVADWETDAVVTEQPAPVGGRVSVKWARAHLPGAGAAITGINVFEPDEQVARLGRLPVRTSRPGPAIARGRQRPGLAGGVSADRLVLMMLASFARRPARPAQQ